MAAVRRHCFDDIGGFDEELTPLEDWELWIHLSERYRFRLIDEPLVRAAVAPDSISRNRSAIVEARARIVEKHRERFDEASLANHLFFVGHGAMKLGRSRTGRRYLRRAVWTNPRVRYAVAAVVAHLGEKPYDATYRAAKALRRV